jgi:hypothetical protein
MLLPPAAVFTMLSVEGFVAEASVSLVTAVIVSMAVVSLTLRFVPSLHDVMSSSVVTAATRRYVLLYKYIQIMNYELRVKKL